MANPYFGEPWDAPAIDDNVQAPTPVGEPCTYCSDKVVEGDQGFLVSAVDLAEDGKTTVASIRPIHRECTIASVIGCGVACVEGRCDCRSGGSARRANGTGPSIRDGARETLDWVQRHGIR